MKKIIENFINQFEIVFHKDWSYTSAMLAVEDETFLNDYNYQPTFIESDWVSNWCNRDELLDSFTKLKRDLARPNANEFTLVDNFKKFIYYFESVFDEDWEYTKMNLGISTEKHSFNEDTIYVIAIDATFLHPNLNEEELEMANWGHRELLLKSYCDVKDALERRMK